jgi:molybdate transport system regulatory protein
MSAIPLGLPLQGKNTKWNHIELLELIDEYGSINKAATTMGMSYKAAWLAVEAINNMSREPVVVRQTGGTLGGGTHLTDYGRRFVHLYRCLEEEQKKLFENLNANFHDFEEYQKLLRKFSMKTSARNQFLGTVVGVKEGAVNADVVLDIGGNERIHAVITNESLEHLALEVGKEAYALFKAPWVILTGEDNFKTSARNKLAGKVTQIHRGTINSEVNVELAGGKIVSAVLTNESLDSLDLKIGVPVCALIKASHVILAVAA